MRTPPLLAAALAAAARGWPVFPLFPGSKRPAISGWAEHATCDPAVLELWWAYAPYNIGTACGEARLLVLDIDGQAGLETFGQLIAAGDLILPTTYTVATPNGEHRYFTVDPSQPGRTTVGKLGPHIDTRGGGGYVVAAGSVRLLHGHRRYYRRTSPPTLDPAPAPPQLLAVLSRTPPGTGQSGNRSAAGPVRRPAAYARAALDGEVRRVRSAQTGKRNVTLFTSAVRLGRLAAAGLLGEQDIAQPLRAASDKHIGVDHFTAAEADRAIRNGLHCAEKRPGIGHV